jgi:hypothetical protein
VAEHGGAGVRVLALHEVEVTVAQACGLCFDQHFPGAGAVDRDVLNVELPGDRVQHGCFHGVLLEIVFEKVGLMK